MNHASAHMNLGTMLRDARLQTDAGSEVTDDHAYYQHHGKRQQVLGIGNRKTVVRRDEQKIEQGDGEHRRRDRRTAPVASHDLDERRVIQTVRGVGYVFARQQD